jgi:Nickel responsive protein SCO4226-like
MVMTGGSGVFTVIHDDDVRPPAGPGGRLHDTSEGWTMALFVIERNFVEQLDADALDYAGIRLVNDDVGVRWLYSFLSADKKKTYCVYEASNSEAIIEAAARLGIPADVIVAVDQIGPDGPGYASSSSIQA